MVVRSSGRTRSRSELPTQSAKCCSYRRTTSGSFLKISRPRTGRLAARRSPNSARKRRNELGRSFALIGATQHRSASFPSHPPSLPATLRFFGVPLLEIVIQFGGTVGGNCAPPSPLVRRLFGFGRR